MDARPTAQSALLPRRRRAPWRAALATCAALLAVSGAASAQQAQDLTAQLAQGRDAVSAGQLDRAEGLLAPVAAAGDARVAAQAEFYLGDLNERRFRFRDALAAYRASLARDPGGRYASRARVRIEYLESHAEGDFAPLAALERVRSDPRLASDPAAIAGLAAAARSFPPGPVRADARLLAGQAYAGRLDRPHDAAPVLFELASDRAAAPEQRRYAQDLLAQVRDRTGEYREGLDELARAGADPSLGARLLQHARRAALFRVAVLLAALVVLAGTVSVARAVRAGRLRPLVRAWLRPLPLAHIAMFSVGGALLAHSYEEHDMRPFFALGAGTLLVYLTASAWALVGSRRPAWVAARSVACAAGMLAVAFLAMHRFDPGLLEGIGL